MSVVKNCSTIRPLLSLSRFETGKFCSYWQLPIYPDISNQKIKFLRNRVRKQIIPIIKLFFNSKIENMLLQLAEIVEAEDRYMTQIAKDLLNSNTSSYSTAYQVENCQTPNKLKEQGNSILSKMTNVSLNDASNFVTLPKSRAEKTCKLSMLSLSINPLPGLLPSETKFASFLRTTPLGYPKDNHCKTRHTKQSLVTHWHWRSQCQSLAALTPKGYTKGSHSRGNVKALPGWKISKGKDAKDNAKDGAFFSFFSALLLPGLALPSKVKVFPGEAKVYRRHRKAKPAKGALCWRSKARDGRNSQGFFLSKALSFPIQRKTQPGLACFAYPKGVCPGFALPSFSNFSNEVKVLKLPKVQLAKGLLRYVSTAQSGLEKQIGTGLVKRECNEKATAKTLLNVLSHLAKAYSSVDETSFYFLIKYNTFQLSKMCFNGFSQNNLYSNSCSNLIKISPVALLSTGKQRTENSKPKLKTMAPIVFFEKPESNQNHRQLATFDISGFLTRSLINNKPFIFCPLSKRWNLWDLLKTSLPYLKNGKFLSTLRSSDVPSFPVAATLKEKALVVTQRTKNAKNALPATLFSQHYSTSFFADLAFHTKGNTKPGLASITHFVSFFPSDYPFGVCTASPGCGSLGVRRKKAKQRFAQQGFGIGRAKALLRLPLYPFGVRGMPLLPPVYPKGVSAARRSQSQGAKDYLCFAREQRDCRQTSTQDFGQIVKQRYVGLRKQGISQYTIETDLLEENYKQIKISLKFWPLTYLYSTNLIVSLKKQQKDYSGEINRFTVFELISMGTSVQHLSFPRVSMPIKASFWIWNKRVYSTKLLKKNQIFPKQAICFSEGVLGCQPREIKGSLHYSSSPFASLASRSEGKTFGNFSNEANLLKLLKLGNAKPVSVAYPKGVRQTLFGRQGHWQQSRKAYPLPRRGIGVDKPFGNASGAKSEYSKPLHKKHVASNQMKKIECMLLNTSTNSLLPRSIPFFPQPMSNDCAPRVFSEMLGIETIQAERRVRQRLIVPSRLSLPLDAKKPSFVTYSIKPISFGLESCCRLSSLEWPIFYQLLAMPLMQSKGLAMQKLSLYCDSSAYPILSWRSKASKGVCLAFDSEQSQGLRRKKKLGLSALQAQSLCSLVKPRFHQGATTNGKSTTSADLTISRENFLISQFFIYFDTLKTERKDFYWPIILSFLPVAFQRRIIRLFLKDQNWGKTQYSPVEEILAQF